MNSIRDKLRRKLSMKEENPNFDDYNDENDVDDDFHGNLSKDVDRAEKENHPQGRPGSMLNRLISHGNAKTDAQIREDQARFEQQSSSLTASKEEETARQQALSSQNK